MLRSLLKWIGLAHLPWLLAIMAGCTRQVSAPASVQIVIQKPSAAVGIKSKWYSLNSTQPFGISSLDDSLCYAVHITADDLFVYKDSSGNTCADDASPHGLGQVEGLFSYGSSASFDVKVGSSRRFDLIGFRKQIRTDLISTGVDAPTAAPADCPRNLTAQLVDVKDSLSGTTRKQVQLYSNGVAFNPQELFLATGTQDIAPGNNVVTLTWVNNSDGSIGKNYSGTCQSSSSGSSSSSAASALTSMIGVTPSTIPADGTSAASLLISLKDATGKAVSGLTPTFSVSGTGNILNQSCTPSDVNGISICASAIATTVVEAKNISLVSPAGLSSLSASLAVTSAAANTANLNNSNGSSFNFGNVTVGASNYFIFTFTNTGSVPANVISASALSAPFSYYGGAYPGTGGTCSTSLVAGSSCTVAVSFSPSSTGSYSSSFTLTFNDGTGTHSVTTALQGTGVGAPGAFSLTSVQAGNGYAVLAWSPSAGAASYTVEYGTTSGSYPVMVSTTATSPFVVSGLTNGMIYYFKVWALNPAGSTGSTNELSATPQLQNPNRFAYVTNEGSNTVSMFSLNVNTGDLMPLPSQKVSTGTAPHRMAVDPSGTHAYVLNMQPSISMFSITPGTGMLVPLSPASLAINASPRGIAVDPTGRFAFTVHDSINKIYYYSVNAATGVLTQNGYVATGAGPAGVSVDPSGRFVYVPNTVGNNVTAYHINQSSGALALIGTYATNVVAPSSVTVMPGGRFAYVTGNNDLSNDGPNVSMHSIDPTTGALTQLGGAFNTGTNPVAITTDPLGRFVYVANSGSGSLSLFKINQGSGYLTANGTVSTGSNPTSLSVDGTGRFLYVSSSTSNSVLLYKINQVDGSLTPLSNFTAATEANASSIVTAVGAARFAYAANMNSYDVTAYTVDAYTGVLTSQGSYPTASPTAYAAYGLTVDPTGRFTYAANPSASKIAMYSINLNTGGLILQGNVGAGTYPYSIAVEPSGRFAYASNDGSNDVYMYSINQSTGALTPLATPSIPAGTYPQVIRVDPSGRFVYTSNYVANSVSMFRIDQTTGALTSVWSDIGSDSGPDGIAVDPLGRFVYTGNGAANSVSMYSIEPNTGQLISNGSIALPASSEPRYISIDPAGRFAYVAERSANAVAMFAIDPVSGALTPLTTPSVGTGTGVYTAQSIHVDATGRFVYVANQSSSTVSMFTLDAMTGLLTLLTSPIVNTGSSPWEIVTTR